MAAGITNSLKSLPKTDRCPEVKLKVLVGMEHPADIQALQAGNGCQL